MGLGDDVKQIASDVGGALGGVVADTAKTVAKTPLDILNEILGGDGAKAAGGAASTNEALQNLEKAGDGAQSTAAQAQTDALKQQDQQTTAAHIARHRANMQAEEQLYQQQTAHLAQQKQIEEQEKKQKEQMEVRQLKHAKSQNMQVSTAKMMADPERSRQMAGAG